MSFKKVDLLFDDANASVDVELHQDQYILCITEYKECEEESTDSNTVKKPSSVTEIYLGDEHIKSVINALNLLRIEYEGGS